MRLHRLLARYRRSLRAPAGPPAQDLNYRTVLTGLNIAWHLSECLPDLRRGAENLCVLDCNELCLQMFKLRQEQVVGRSHQAIWPKADPFWNDILMQVIETGQPVHFERASGYMPSSVWDCYVFRPAPLRVGAFFHEIHERIETQQAIQALNRKLVARTVELEEAVQALEAFTYTVTHDLRAPVRYLAGFTDLLQNELGPGASAKGRHYLDVIRQSVGNMGQLVERLLDLSRSGNAPLKQEEVRLDDLAATAWASLAPDREGRRIQAEFGPLPRVSGDLILLQVVFSNLLGNAVKYTLPQAEARIQVGCREGDQDWTVFVRDNGVGFDPNLASRLFQVFQRLHADPRIQGTGIGLATVQRIIQRHGGRVWAEGEPDRGATFYFTLPRTMSTPQ